MFQPKFRLVLNANNFFPGTLICLGMQMAELIKFLKTHLPPHVWYGADIDAFGQVIKKYELESRMIKKIGESDVFIKICQEIEQFLSGVFLAIKNDQDNVLRGLELYTEDPPFREIHENGILLEIRTFDTTYIEVFSEDAGILNEISQKFKKCETC